MSEFFIKRGAKVQGPLSLATVKRLADAGKLRESDLIARSKSSVFTEITHYFKLSQAQGQASGKPRTTSPSSDTSAKTQSDTRADQVPTLDGREATDQTPPKSVATKSASTLQQVNADAYKAKESSPPPIPSLTRTNEQTTQPTHVVQRTPTSTVHKADGLLNKTASSSTPPIPTSSRSSNHTLIVIGGISGGLLLLLIMVILVIAMKTGTATKVAVRTDFAENQSVAPKANKPVAQVEAGEEQKRLAEEEQKQEEQTTARLLANRQLVAKKLAWGDSEEIIRLVLPDHKFAKNDLGNGVTMLSTAGDDPASDIAGHKCIIELKLFKNQLWEFALRRKRGLGLDFNNLYLESGKVESVSKLLAEKYGPPAKFDDKSFNLEFQSFGEKLFMGNKLGDYQWARGYTWEASDSRIYLQGSFFGDVNLAEHSEFRLTYT